MNRYLFGRSRNVVYSPLNDTCEVRDGSQYLKFLKLGDFVFFQDTNLKGPNIHLLLKCLDKSIDAATGDGIAKFAIILDLRRNPLLKIDFQRLVFFKMDTVLLCNIVMPSRNNGFHELSVSKQKTLDDYVLNNPADFESELRNTNGPLFRKLIFAPAAPTGPSEDVVFYPDETTKSGIRYADTSFMPPWGAEVDERAANALDKSSAGKYCVTFRNWINDSIKHSSTSKAPEFQVLYNVLWWKKGAKKKTKKTINEAAGSKNDSPLSTDICSQQLSSGDLLMAFKETLKNAGLDERGYNKIYYGIPGCGKSHKVNLLINGKSHFRTVFYEDYSYTDFIGQVAPELNGDAGKNSFRPGPFAKAMKEAYDSLKNGHPELVYLIIEEINRGKAPSIFGDAFQLLDRDDDGWSEYGIEQNDLLAYLGIPGLSEVRLPGNLIVLATMNTADQNVFTLDTAFKRRFLFEEVMDDWTTCAYRDYLVPGTNVTWREFVAKINAQIVSLKASSGLSDDKRLASHFLSSSSLVDPNHVFDWSNALDLEIAKRFAYKAIEYLYDDVARWNPNSLFAPNISTLSDAIASFLNPSIDLKAIFPYAGF